MQLDISDGRNIRNFLIKQFGREVDENGNPRSEIKMNFPSTVVVIGLGGIGGHLAEYIGAMKNITNLIVIDDDEVELSNLNRTVYSYFHVGMPKVEAITAQIMSRNMGIRVKPLMTRFDSDLVTTVLEEGAGFTFHEIFGSPKEVLIFDCRDDFYDDFDEFKRLFNDKCKYRLLRAAYDGLSMTLDANPEEHYVWGGNRGYETIPSHAIPSRLVASLIISMATSIYNDSDRHLASRFDAPITFHLFDLVPLMFDGLKYRESIEQKTIPVNIPETSDDDDDGDEEESSESLNAEVASVEAGFSGTADAPEISDELTTGTGVG